MDMARIPGVDPSSPDPALRATFEAQSRRWGAPLLPFLYYGRRPTIFRAVRGMWAAIDDSGLVDGGLKALLNRRVAALNGCAF
jgi:hypothetical protein